MSRFDAFLTHTWQIDEENRNNHNRVKKIYQKLTDKGLKIWFDENEMNGDVITCMINGIDQSTVIVACLTQKYIDKVASSNPSDNCFKEFSYATRTKTATNMIVVPMEAKVMCPTQWKGRVQMELGGLLYESNFASDDETAFNANIDCLYRQIVRKAGVTVNVPTATTTTTTTASIHPTATTATPTTPTASIHPTATTATPTTPTAHPSGFSIGAKVTWKFEDEDVPKGTVGTIKQFYNEEKKASVVFSTLPSNACFKFNWTRLNLVV